MPDRWLRKFSAVRSAVRMEASGPATVPMVVPAATASPSSARQSTPTAGSSWAKVSVAQRVPASTPSLRGHERRRRLDAGVEQRGREVAERLEVLGERGRHGAPDLGDRRVVDRCHRSSTVQLH